MNFADLEKKDGLEAKIISTTLELVMPFLLIVIIYDLFITGKFFFVVTDFFLLLIFGNLWYFSKYKKSFHLILKPVYFLVIASLTSLYFQEGGINGIIGCDFLLLGLLTLLLFNGMERFILFSLLVFVLALLFFCQINYPYLFVNHYKNNLGIFLGFSYRFILFCVLGYVIKTEYEKERRQVYKQNIEIKKQHREIQIQKEKLLQINESLEMMVKERTSEIELQNQKLIDYANFNSHKVRGPLARILGLIYLIRLEGVNNESDYFLLFVEKLEVASQELDLVIKEINEILDHPKY